MSLLVRGCVGRLEFVPRSLRRRPCSTSSSSTHALRRSPGFTRGFSSIGSSSGATLNGSLNGGKDNNTSAIDEKNATNTATSETHFGFRQVPEDAKEELVGEVSECEVLFFARYETGVD
jgi:hypothetical protein